MAEVDNQTLLELRLLIKVLGGETKHHMAEVIHLRIGMLARMRNARNPGPSQGNNTEDTRNVGGADYRIDQVVTAVAQMVAMLTQAIGMPIPPTVQ